MLIMTRTPAKLRGTWTANSDKSTVVVTGPDGLRVVVRVLEIRSSSGVAIGIDAPKGWDISRRELLSAPPVVAAEPA